MGGGMKKAANRIKKMNTEATNTDALRAQAKQISDKIDSIVKDGGRVGLNDPLSRQLMALRAKIKLAKEEVEYIDEDLSNWKNKITHVHGDDVKFSKEKHKDGKTYHTTATSKSGKQVGNYVHSGPMQGGRVMDKSGSKVYGEEVEQVDEMFANRTDKPLSKRSTSRINSVVKKALGKTEATKHRIQVTLSEPDHPMVSKRNETIQKHIRVPGEHSKKDAVAKAEAHYKKKGYKVHSAEHVGMVKEEVSKAAPTADAPKMVRDRKTGELYDPNKKFKELMDKPETKGVMKRLAKEEVDLDEMTQGKEYTQAQLQKKIQSGNWEATHDIKPGKHVEMRHHTGKKVMVQVKEDLEQIDEGAYEKSEENKRSADAAKKQGDMFAHHLHMADHHENLSQWHSSKGRHGEADKHAEKAEEHQDLAMKHKVKKEEVAANNVGDAKIAGTQGDAGKKSVMTKPVLKRKVVDFKEFVENLEEGKPGLWANIHAKRKRIASGSGERMRKPGSKGAPTKKEFIKSKKTAVPNCLKNNIYSL
jgi:hypothetical protein